MTGQSRLVLAEKSVKVKNIYVALYQTRVLLDRTQTALQKGRTARQDQVQGGSRGAVQEALPDQ